MTASSKGKTSETLQFTMHSNLLMDVIKRQAGTLSKAILEGVQNSVDAGATVCNVTLDEKHFVIEDDGRGFNGKQEIERVFGQFGTPHVKGDAKLGRYRIGRGQILSFANTTYDSGSFTMQADIRNKGLSYEFTDHGEQIIKGCRVTGLLYTKLLPSDLLAMQREFREYAEYAPIPVILNGKQINKLPQEMQWDIENDDVYIKFKQSGGVKAYNIGFFVRRYHESHFGVSALVVSKNQLEVNFARNDILVSECPIWRDVTKLLRANGTTKAKRATTLTDEGRALTVQRLITGEESIVEVAKIKVFRDACGKYYNLNGLLRLNKPIALAPSDKDHMADLIQKSGQAIVLSPMVTEWFEVDTLEQMRDYLLELSRTDKQDLMDTDRWEMNGLHYAIEKLEIADYASLRQGYNPEYRTLDDKDLTPVELALLKDLRASMYGFYHRVVAGYDQELPERKLMVGDAETAEYWTDGSTFIAINRAALNRMIRTKTGAYSVLQTLAHQYAFNQDTRQGGMVSDIEFYERYMNYTLESADTVGKLLIDLQRSIFKTATKYNINLNRGVTGALDVLSQYAGDDTDDSDDSGTIHLKKIA